MVFLGGILAVTGYFVPSPVSAIAGWFMICFGAGVCVLGWVNLGNGDSDLDKTTTSSSYLCWSAHLLYSSLSSCWQYVNQATSSSRASPPMEAEVRPSLKRPRNFVCSSTLFLVGVKLWCSQRDVTISLVKRIIANLLESVHSLAGSHWLGSGRAIGMPSGDQCQPLSSP